MKLSCPADRSLYHTFTIPDGCACSKCSSSSSALESSSSAGAFWQQSTGEDWGQRQTGGDGLPWPDPASDPWHSAAGAETWDPAGGASPWDAAGAANPWGASGEDAFSQDNGKDAGLARTLGGGDAGEGLSDSELMEMLLNEAGADPNEIGTGPIH